jgi:hypothetical protein
MLQYCKAVSHTNNGNGNKAKEDFVLLLSCQRSIVDRLSFIDERVQVSAVLHGSCVKARPNGDWRQTQIWSGRLGQTIRKLEKERTVVLDAMQLQRDNGKLAHGPKPRPSSYKELPKAKD